METNNKKLKFAMLFSGGKDSTIALGKMIRAGHIPVCIVVGKMTDGLTHMHLLRDTCMDRYSDTLAAGNPLYIINSIPSHIMISESVSWLVCLQVRD